MNWLGLIEVVRMNWMGQLIEAVGMSWTGLTEAVRMNWMGQISAVGQSSMVLPIQSVDKWVGRMEYFVENK